MATARPHLIPGPDHPITVEPSTDHVVVRVGEIVVAESRTPLVLREAAYPAVYYLPEDSANWAVLRRSESTTYCPYKGEASYYDVVTDDGVVADAVWVYEEPYPAVGAIRRHLAFYPDRVQIAVS